MSDLSAAAGSCPHSELSWYSPGKVMCLRISGDYRLEDCRQINAAITKELDESADDLILLIDAMAMSRPYHFDQIRATQTYRDHTKLKHIYVVAQDRLVKLALMIIFNISRAHLHLFDDIDSAGNMLKLQISQVH